MFPNPYTRSPRVVDTTDGPRTMIGASFRPVHRPGLGRTRALVLFLLAPALLCASAALAVGHPTASAATGSSYGGFISNRVDIVFPAPTPGIELLDHSNHSIGVGLTISHIVEMLPGTASDPIVVQVASPTNGSPFEPTSATSGQDSFALNLHGLLPVLPTHAPLWTNPVGSLPTNSSGSGFPPTAPEATLVVSYQLTTGPTNLQGLELSWSIKGWPWLAHNDLLGIEAMFTVFNATSFRVCPALAAVNASESQCHGGALAPGATLWNSPTLTSVLGEDRQGLTAGLAWGTTQSATGVGPEPVSAGTYYAEPNLDRVTLASSAQGASNVTSDARLALALPPSLAGVPKVLGNPWAFGVASVVFAAVAMGAIVAYRRREERIREQL